MVVSVMGFVWVICFDGISLSHVASMCLWVTEHEGFVHEVCFPAVPEGLTNVTLVERWCVNACRLFCLLPFHVQSHVLSALGLTCFYCHHTSNALFAFVIGFLPGWSQPHRPDLRFGTPLCPAAASLAACTGFTGGRCFKFCLFPSQCCSPGHSRKPFQGAWASQAACVFPGPMGAVLAHTASSQTGPCLLAGWRRRDDTLPVFCSPRLSGMCSGVNTESSRQQSLVLHELSIKQDVVQLRLEANWLEINYSRLFLWICFPPVVHFESSCETENLNVFCKYGMSPYL